MPECDYCGERFDGEDALLEHMGDEHEGELGRIDRRRVAELEGDDRDVPAGPIAIALIVFISAAVVAYVVFGAGGGGNGGGQATPVPMGDVSPSGLEAEPLPDSGDNATLAEVETFPSEGNDHVQSGTEVDYGTSPPTSGDHYPNPAPAGFYTETPPLGNLVHSLEHGNVVVYYDPAAITPEARESLEESAAAHGDDPWASVVVAPTPNDEPESPYVLTAWRQMLRLDSYDARTVQAFLAEYIGRGPENPVR
jgi:hypothetical protein